MNTCPAYCAMRDRDVYVVLPDDPSQATQANPTDLAVICRTYSYAAVCTGDFCPNFPDGHVAVGVRPKVAS